MAGTEYEFVLKELPDNGAAPQAAFAYGNEIYRTRTRHTTLNYTHLEPILLPNRRYAWQVQAIARDGVDELGLFEHGGFERNILVHAQRELPRAHGAEGGSPLC